MRKLRPGRIKSEGNKALKAARFILLLTEANEVIDSIFDRFNVAVEHRRVCLQSGVMHGSGKLEPTFCVTLVRANHRPCRLAKDLRAAAGARIQPRIDQLLNDVLVLHFVEMSEMIQLDHRKGFQMKL